MSRLTANTALMHPDTLVVTPLAAGDEVPEWAEGLIGDHIIDTSTPAVAEDSPAGDDPSEEWTVADLRDYAKAHDVDLHGATSKADILAAIQG